jgi:hypothetical protein
MKKLFILISSLLLILGISSCEDKEGDVTPPKPVENIAVKAGYGELMFSWTQPGDSDLYYVDITYTDSKGKKRSSKVSHYVFNDTLSGFADTSEYTFQLTAYDKSGNASKGMIASARPLAPAFDKVAGTLSMSPDFGGARIAWKNETGKTVTIRVAYKNNDGAPVTSFFTSNKEISEGIISGLNATKRTFTAVVTDISESISQAKTFDITPLSEVKIPKTQWTVVDVSSEEPAENPNGYASKIFDGNLNSFWHTKWNGSQPGYPHWVIVDMHQGITVSRFECFRRQGDGRGQTKIQFLTSTDGTVWTDQGQFDFNPAIDDGQSFRMVTNPSARYFKYVAVAGPNFFAFVAEINVYGAGE